MHMEQLNKRSHSPRTDIWISFCIGLNISYGVPGSTPHVVAVVPLGNALCPHCQVPKGGPKAVSPLVDYKELAFVVAR